MKLRTGIIAIALLLCGASATAEQADRIDIDYKQIEVNVSMNPSHYREQLQRFVEGDSTMRLDEVALVYYGYPSTFDYDPTADYSDIKELYANKNYKEALQRIRQEIKVDPVNLDLIVMGAIAASESGEAEDQAFADNMQNSFDQLISTILASGSGIDASSPFKIIRAADAMILLRNVLGITDIVNDATADNILAYVFHFPGNQRDNILYFDIAPQNDYFKR